MDGTAKTGEPRAWYAVSSALPMRFVVPASLAGAAHYLLTVVVCVLAALAMRKFAMAGQWPSAMAAAGMLGIGVVQAYVVQGLTSKRG